MADPADLTRRPVIGTKNTAEETMFSAVLVDTSPSHAFNMHGQKRKQYVCISVHYSVSVPLSEFWYSIQASRIKTIDKKAPDPGEKGTLFPPTQVGGLYDVVL